MKTLRQALGWATLAALLWGLAQTALAAPRSQGGPPPAPVGPAPGPYYHRVSLAYSQDGLQQWQVEETPLREHISMPDMVYWQGTLWVYGVDGADPGLVVLHQNADGTWQEARVQMEGEEQATLADPDVVVLPDGRLRLYFIHFGPPPAPNAPPPNGAVYSAVSEDGVHFTVEEGERLRAEALVTDPDVVQLGETWWMYALGAQGLVAARSEDGLNFVAVGHVPAEGTSGTLALEDGRLRQFYCGQGGTRARHSSDGLRWEGNALVLPDYCASNPVRLPDGTWVLPALSVDMEAFQADLANGSVGPGGETPPEGAPPGGPGAGLGAPMDGAAAPPPQGQPPQGGPYYHQVYLARSDDGLRWESLGMVRDHASVPELVRWQETLWIYAVDGLEHGLIVLRQGADGTWTEERVQIAGFDARHAVDPDVTVLPDGRLRLYFLDFSTLQGAPNTSAQSTIYSAVSEDGVHFSLEEGERFRMDGIATDPDVVQFGGAWWMYVSQGTQLTITSGSDGLSFQAVGTSNNGGVSNTVVLEDGSLRQYVCQGGILAQRSTDALHWTVESGTLIPNACDPSVIREADGSWLMAYKAYATP